MKNNIKIGSNGELLMPKKLEEASLRTIADDETGRLKTSNSSCGGGGGGNNSSCSNSSCVGSENGNCENGTCAIQLV